MIVLRFKILGYLNVCVFLLGAVIHSNGNRESGKPTPDTGLQGKKHSTFRMWVNVFMYDRSGYKTLRKNIRQSSSVCYTTEARKLSLAKSGQSI